MVLKLTSTLSKSEYIFEHLEDNLTSRIFWDFSITLPQGIKDGEFQYVLTYDDGTVEATGLCIVGDFVPETHPYTGDTTIKESNGYIQYGQ